MRTTLDIDGPILRELKDRARREGKSLGRLASDLLAGALRGGGEAPGREIFPVWVSKPMGARVDLSDPQALHTAMEESRDAGAARVAEDS